MARQVTLESNGVLQVQFPFDRRLVDRIKSLPNRRWNATDRSWLVPEADVVLLVDLLSSERFGFDRATRDLYASMGGSAELGDLPAPRTEPSLPGLFDDLPDAPTVGTAGSRTRPATNDYTVSSLNERVSSVIEQTFPAPVWIVGEISGFDESAHRRHVGFELVERGPGGDTVSRVSATMFQSTRHEIERSLRTAGDPFRLEDEILVRFRARIELYVPWGQYRVVIEELDVAFTLGEAARRREEIVRRLTEAGIIERNRSLPISPVPLRVALITSLGSDAYNDVMRTLKESGYAFEVTAHGARVQGHATEPSVLNALDWIRERSELFDVVLICRGGGSRTDLVWFDSEPLGRAVAELPLPVLVGIGHEQDVSVLDSVGRSCKTPTAAATFLVETVRGNLSRLDSSVGRVLEAARSEIREQRERVTQRGRRVALASRSLLRHEHTRLDHQRQRVVRLARQTLREERKRLARWIELIPKAGTLHLEKQRLLMATVVRSLGRSSYRLVGEASTRITTHAEALRPGATRLLSLEAERLEARERRLRLVDPRRVIERGYAILRDVTGSVVTDPAGATAGARLTAELRLGLLQLRSEGPPVKEEENDAQDR